jgi:hypothetical protein
MSYIVSDVEPIGGYSAEPMADRRKAAEALRLLRRLVTAFWPRTRSVRLLPPAADIAALAHGSSVPILLQKSFALVTKNSPGRRRDFRVKMWGTSSPDDKLTGDLGNVIESTQIGGRRSDCPMA